jgi:hypothetical protein
MPTLGTDVEPFLIAVAIDEAALRKLPDADYRQRMRTLYFNLNDKRTQTSVEEWYWEKYLQQTSL